MRVVGKFTPTPQHKLGLRWSILQEKEVLPQEKNLEIFLLDILQTTF